MRISAVFRGILLALLLLIGGVAFSQLAGPAARVAGDQSVHPAEALTGAEVRSVIQQLATQLSSNFVFPAAGKQYAVGLRSKLAAGEYDAITDPLAFAHRVTQDLQSVAPSGQLRLSMPEMSSGMHPARWDRHPPIENARWIADGVAYIRINHFSSDPEALESLDQFMADHASARALIVDARTHRGGGILPMDTMLSYLYSAPMLLAVIETRAEPDRTVFFEMDGISSMHRVASPENVVRREHRSRPHPHEKRLFDVNLYYLTSRKTASAAEHFAMILKSTKRATLVGETTSGAGHFGILPRIGRFSAFIPVGRTYDPHSGQGWEAIGIKPDIEVPAGYALREALKRINGTASPVRAPSS